MLERLCFFGRELSLVEQSVPRGPTLAEMANVGLRDDFHASPVNGISNVVARRCHGYTRSKRCAVATVRSAASSVWRTRPSSDQ